MVSLRLSVLLVTSIVLIAACVEPHTPPPTSPVRGEHRVEPYTPPTSAQEYADHRDAVAQSMWMRGVRMKAWHEEVEVVGGRFPVVENEGDLPDLSAERLEDAIREALIDYFGGLRQRHRSRFSPGVDLSVRASPAMDRASGEHSEGLAARGGYRDLNPPGGLLLGECGGVVYAVGMKVALVMESEWVGEHSERYSRARATRWFADEPSRARAVVPSFLALDFATAEGVIREEALLTSYVGVGVAEGRDDLLGTDAWYVTIMTSPCDP